jgi:hypothetical protein
VLLPSALGPDGSQTSALRCSALHPSRSPSNGLTVHDTLRVIGSKGSEPTHYRKLCGDSLGISPGNGFMKIRAPKALSSCL